KEEARRRATEEEEKAKQALADRETALARKREEEKQKIAALLKARKAVNEFLQTVGTNPHLQGDLNSQKITLLASAIPFLQDFVKQHPDDPDLEAEMALAYGDLAFVRSETGDPLGALADLERVEAIFRRLVAAHPNRAEFRVRLAACLNDRAKVLADL